MGTVQRSSLMFTKRKLGTLAISVSVRFWGFTTCKALADLGACIISCLILSGIDLALPELTHNLHDVRDNRSINSLKPFGFANATDPYNGGKFKFPV
ncbi:hypothetical protein Tco_0327032 [Tanacetum coccineum]